MANSSDDLEDYDEDDICVFQSKVADILDLHVDMDPVQKINDSSDDDDNDDNTVCRGSSYASVQSVSFRDFLLKPELLRAIIDIGFEHPSEVQLECIPQAMVGTDILCQARSGMGKTAIFVLSALQQLDLEPTDRDVLVLVLCNTRELALQVQNIFTRFCKYLPEVRSAVVFGGISMRHDIELLSNKDTCPHILVGTPGRVVALVQDNLLNLKCIRHFILDECDKMLDELDMRQDVQEIFRAAPHTKQVMMFTATLSPSTRSICKRFMKNPLEIHVDDDSRLTLHGLQQYYVRVLEHEKNRKLSDLLDTLEFNQIVIFVKSVSRCIELDRLLKECSFPSAAIHKGVAQPDRIKLFTAFKNFEKRILVATDVFSRGVDISRVNVVLNYDMSEDATAYLHRVGRAGRFGSKGLAITFVANDQDLAVMSEIHSRFEVNISELPEHIELATYMTA